MKRRGAVMIDALIGIMVLGMGAITYYAMLPTVHRSQQISQQESKAAQIAARVTEQIAMLKPSEVTASNLYQIGVLDPSQAAQPWTFTRIPLDDGTSYSPAKVLRNGTGVITTTSIAQGSLLVKVEVKWTSPTGKARSLVTGTVVGGYR